MRDANEVRTGKMYEKDAYACSFESEVLAFDGEWLTLAETLFFPEEGGQCPDTGTIAGFPVTDVQIRDGEIRHRIGRTGACDDPCAVFLPGRPVPGFIDREARFSNMQQHSGEHLLSGAVCRLAGCSNSGFHLSPNEVTVDFDRPLSQELLREAVREANRFVAADLQTEILYLDEEERKAYPYRSKLDLQGIVRIVVFPGADACACCAPHVKRTGEIGLIRILRAISYKGGTRLWILCGERARLQMEEEHELLVKTANGLSASCAEVPELVAGLKEENQLLKQQLKAEIRKRLLLQAAAVPEEERSVLLFEEGLEAASLRDAVNALTERHPGVCGAFSGNDREGYRFVLGSRTEDAREACRILREAFAARGGGKPDMVQGSVSASREELERLLKGR